MNCSKFDTCEKIDMILDHDMLDFQRAEVIRNTCSACPNKREVIVMCVLSGQSDACVGAECPMYLKCFGKPRQKVCETCEYHKWLNGEKCLRNMKLHVKNCKEWSEAGHLVSWRNVCVS